MANTKISALTTLAQADIDSSADLLPIVDNSATETKKATPAALIGAAIDDATAKTTPVDADTVPLTDSADSNVLKKLSWANIKATLKTYFDTLYHAFATVINSNVTAANDAFYTVVASATFTDPSPTEGKGYTVFVRNGTATIGGTGYSTAGAVIRRIYHSGAWATYVDDPSLKVDKSSVPVVIQLACSDLTTALTTGTSKAYFRAGYAFTLTGVRASLLEAQTSGSIFTVDINDSGTTVLSTKLTIDNNEKTSTTAATAAVISDSAIADDAEITIDIDQVGTGAKGLIVTLIGTRSI